MDNPLVSVSNRLMQLELGRRSGDRSLGRSIAVNRPLRPSRGRLLPRSLDRSLHWSCPRSLGHALGRPIAQSLAQSVDQTDDRSSGVTLGRPLVRSTTAKSWVCQAARNQRPRSLAPTIIGYNRVCRSKIVLSFYV